MQACGITKSLLGVEQRDCRPEQGEELQEVSKGNARSTMPSNGGDPVVKAQLDREPAEHILHAMVAVRLNEEDNFAHYSLNFMVELSYRFLVSICRVRRSWWLKIELARHLTRLLILTVICRRMSMLIWRLSQFRRPTNLHRYCAHSLKGCLVVGFLVRVSQLDPMFPLIF